MFKMAIQKNQTWRQTNNFENELGHEFPFAETSVPDPDPSINKPKDQKILISTLQWFIRDFLSLKNDVNVPSKRNKHLNLVKKKYFLLASWRSLTKKAGSGSGSVNQMYGCAVPRMAGRVRRPVARAPPPPAPGTWTASAARSQTSSLWNLSIFWRRGFEINWWFLLYFKPGTRPCIFSLPIIIMPHMAVILKPAHSSLQ